MGPADGGRRSECAPQGFRVHPKGRVKQDLKPDLRYSRESGAKYFSRNTLVWWATCPAIMYARARTVTGLSLAIPVRDQASSGMFLKKEMVEDRRFLNSSTSSAHEVSLAWA